MGIKSTARTCSLQKNIFLDSFRLVPSTVEKTGNPENIQMLTMQLFYLDKSDCTCYRAALSKEKIVLRIFLYGGVSHAIVSTPEENTCWRGNKAHVYRVQKHNFQQIERHILLFNKAVFPCVKSSSSSSSSRPYSVWFCPHPWAVWNNLTRYSQGFKYRFRYQDSLSQLRPNLYS